MLEGERMKESKSTSISSYDIGRQCPQADKTFNNILKSEKPDLLLHACCGPCATSCVERLYSDYSITVFYYNPNITDIEEYIIRRDNLKQFIRLFNEKNNQNIKYLEGEYDSKNFIDNTYNLKNEPEGGSRCKICFDIRLKKTAKTARDLGFDFFTTTLTVSPHKDYKSISKIGLQLERDYQVKYLDIDFKKKNGFGRSIELSKEYCLFRQNFCGCEYARNINTI